ncbi:thioredoxin family protein [Lysinibacillus sp. 2017]|uniref:thioredoxin family protein n=1 Tax=unclassified Lysinibacillus TaxID=2636778 RepID=UPI000D5282FE|nr:MULTISPECIES: thioredoxin family protein [unclassified Lysinibacillus]AWE08822.1 thioredoxin family protein [Lysinibacillus sp. 2017]TGN36144.1 thioredoxin family protein [Lysinibacillus sp. S2017]
MKTEQHYFEESTLMKDYMDGMSQMKDQSFAVYEGFNVPQEDAFIERLKKANVHILAITEDWCGDAMVNNPVIRKIAEAANVEIRTALRDADTDLIDRYLTNGGRAIPMYLVLNESGEVITTWGPRAPQLQQLVMDLRAGLPAKEDPTFEQAQAAVYENMRKQYAENPVLWNYVYEDFKKKVSEAI